MGSERLTDEQITRLIFTEYSTDVPSRYIRLMAAELIELRDLLEIVEKENEDLREQNFAMNKTIAKLQK